jgi:uncharacterized protein YndB with AHSA1/START domain
VTDDSIRIEAPAEIVFRMLTEAELLTEWMAREAQVECRPGGSFPWVYENGDVVLGAFVEIEAPHRLVMTYGWEKPASRGIPPGSTEVEDPLSEVNGGTQLRLAHRGLPDAAVESHVGGWNFFLTRLRNGMADNEGGIRDD